MAEEKNTKYSQNMENNPSYVPASPAKRAAAWVGVVYMVLIVLLTTYYLATGRAMNGIAGLMLAPAAGGFAVVSVLRARAETGTPERAGRWGIALLSAALCVACLIWGVAGLRANFSALAAVIGISTLGG